MNAHCDYQTKCLMLCDTPSAKLAVVHCTLMQIKPIHNCVRSRKWIHKRVNERPHSLTAFNNNARLFVPSEKIELSQHEYNKHI